MDVIAVNAPIMMPFLVSSKASIKVFHGFPELTFLFTAFVQTRIVISDSEDGLTRITFLEVPNGINRLWFRLKSTGSEEHVYGGGEQFSYFDLNRKTFPMWLQEQVGNCVLY